MRESETETHIPLRHSWNADFAVFAGKDLQYLFMNPKRPSKKVTYDNRSFTIEGKRTLIISGEIHYARMPREEWSAVLDESVACGINTVAIYVFWNWHETQRGVYDFSGDRDLAHFLQLCADRKLQVILRAGPYCCAEWNFGGYPPYLKDEPGITIRTWNKPYLDRVEKYFRHLVPEFQPFLASNGGPIVLVQVENEYLNVSKRYGRGGVRYLKWMAGLVRELGVDVPLIMCEGGVEDVVETLNGFSMAEERVNAFRKSHPDLPLVWTEMWPAWYNTWGFAEHRRDPKNIAFYILDWLSQGGSGWNYYMWFGGTNFSRNAMYLQATSYGFDAPLDEYGRPSLSARYLTGLHRVLLAHSETILSGKRIVRQLEQGSKRIEWRHKKETLVLEINEAVTSGLLKDGAGKILFDVDQSFQRVNKSFRAPAWGRTLEVDAWQYWSEPFPKDRTDGLKAVRPVEQLLLTGDRTDYCWYAAAVSLKKTGAQTLSIPFCADVLRVYLNGKLVGQTRGPLLENRGPTLPQPPRKKASAINILELDQGRYNQSFVFEAPAGLYRLEVLAASIGLIKGDWMVSGSMNTDRRGIWQGVFLNGKEVLNWSMHPGLVGERLHVVQNPEAVPWTAPGASRHCTWHSSTFRLSEKLLKASAAFRLDAGGLDKGMLFINGHGLGRHWLITVQGYGADERWQQTQKHGLYVEHDGEPTQRYCKVPVAWLRPVNRLVIF